MARDHRRLKAFQLADRLVIAVYRATREFPDEERFGLTSQMRRAAVSAAGNIVEGAAREGEADFLRFLDIALASLRELGYYVDLSARLGYLSSSEAAQLHSGYDEAARVLQGLIRSIRGAGHAP